MVPGLESLQTAWERNIHVTNRTLEIKEGHTK